MSGGEVGLTIYTTTFSCKPRPLLSDGDVLDLGEISSARFNAYMLTLATSISQILPRILMNLPNSVRQLMDGTTTLPSSTIIWITPTNINRKHHCPAVFAIKKKGNQTTRRKTP